MRPYNSKKKVIILYGNLRGPGGAERLMWEQVKFFERNRVEVHVLAYEFCEETTFNGTYQHPVEVLDNGKSHRFFFRFLTKVLVLRKKIYDLEPDVVISQTPWDSPYVYFALMFTPFRYVTQIPGTVFWFSGIGSIEYYKYALIHKSVFDEIRKSVVGHKEFIPVKTPKMSIFNWLQIEFNAILLYIGMRGAQVRFVHTNHMAWEVKKLYGKDAVVLKGAFPSKIFDYQPKTDIKGKLGLNDKRIILNVNRLDPRKRIDLLLRSFKIVAGKIPDSFLVIGGKGPDENRLKNLVYKLGIKNRVRFVGFIPDEQLYDYYCCCDIFVHPQWADFCIAPLEALAFGKRVVWSTEVELDEVQTQLVGDFIFPVEPTKEAFARALIIALFTKPSKRSDLAQLLSQYTWDKYFEKILERCIYL